MKQSMSPYCALAPAKTLISPWLTTMNSLALEFNPAMYKATTGLQYNLPDTGRLLIK
jgi:hypothetical protein